MLSKTVAAISQLLGVGRATIYRYLVLLGIPTGSSQKLAVCVCPVVMRTPTWTATSARVVRFS